MLLQEGYTLIGLGRGRRCSVEGMTDEISKRGDGDCERYPLAPVQSERIQDREAKHYRHANRKDVALQPERHGLFISQDRLNLGSYTRRDFSGITLQFQAQTGTLEECSPPRQDLLQSEARKPEVPLLHLQLGNAHSG